MSHQDRRRVAVMDGTPPSVSDAVTLLDIRAPTVEIRSPEEAAQETLRRVGSDLWRAIGTHGKARKAHVQGTDGDGRS